MSTIVIDTEPLSPSGERYREDLQKDVSELPRVPAPAYRHAAPSAPWPWKNFDADPNEACPLPPGGLGEGPEWSHYPQRLFGNWTRGPVERCRILKIPNRETCSVHKVDVFTDGTFDRRDEGCTIKVENPKLYRELLGISPPPSVRARALFVENMTVPVLQILGTKYNIEPFFFASSINWIPSRYQEDPKPTEDHITVVLPFIRVMKNQKPIVRTRPIRTASFPLNRLDSRTKESLPYKDERQIIDTQAPLLLPDNKILLLDLLAIHMHRTSITSTIISYHPSSELQKTSAKRLHSLVQRTGESVYWSNIFKKSKDSTFLCLAMLWYALYAWDEAFEVLYHYINALESEVLKFDDIKLTHELHKLQAYLLYYQQLLRDFRVSVDFIRDTPNPAMSVLARDDAERDDSARLFCEEADNLISEIDRLTGQRTMMSDRLENAIHLAFASVNIAESKIMKQLAIATMIDSSAMKQISYLSLIFLPGFFLTNVFRTNVRQIHPSSTGSFALYLEITFGLTLLTSWITIALQSESSFHPRSDVNGIIGRTLWPFFYVYERVTTPVPVRSVGCKSTASKLRFGDA